MSDDYLWDRSGQPDPEIEDLERILRPLGYRPDGALPALQRQVAHRRRWPGAIAAAALIAVATWQVMPGLLPESGWTVAEVTGSARIGSRDATLSTRIAQGVVMRTGRDTRLLLHSTDFGRIQVEPESELVVSASSRTHQEFSLRRGLIHALIWAPPQRFVVETPSARAIDLGCEYTLSVSDRGDGLLNVFTGWVAFQTRGREVFIPAGAACRTTKPAGPGIPWFRDAPALLQESLEKFEDTGDPAELARLLSAARPRDGLTLWHLLRRVPRSQRVTVLDRFVDLVGLPNGVSRGQVLAGNIGALDLCWNALNLESTYWWRQWKRDWER